MIALIRFDASRTFRAHGRACAVALLTVDELSADAWLLLADECEGLGAHRTGTVGRRVLADACGLMARGDVDGAVARLAEECGLSVECWANETRREMGARS